VLAASGVGIGLAGAAVAGRAMKSLLYHVSALDAATLSGASLFLLLVALAASAIPARRATRVNPVEVLRSE
jgi:putative ABC transport system permease protein